MERGSLARLFFLYLCLFVVYSLNCQLDVERFEAAKLPASKRDSVDSAEEGELSPRSEHFTEKAILPNRANDYLERLLTLLILVRFIATLEQFLAVNSIADAEQSLLMKQLSACQVQLIEGLFWFQRRADPLRALAFAPSVGAALRCESFRRPRTLLTHANIMS